MQIYYKTQSLEQPKDFEINLFKVFIAKNITYHEVTSEEQDEETPMSSYYEFDLYEYTPNEYIEILKQQNETLNTEILDTQMALCEIYETMGAMG